GAVSLALVSVLGAAPPRRKSSHFCRHHGGHAIVDSHPMFSGPPGGTWYWMRSPEEEKQAAAALFNRYCIRCHGIDGRGVWDIPGIPNFTNVRFHASRSDDQLARAIMQGRGAVMPPFRGALTLEEAWALARYVRGFIPGTEVSRPDEDESQQARPETKPGKRERKAKAQGGGQPSAENLPPPKAE
ncbi:MAG TPA: cytochrome c, partial [Pirellulales bacterium]|nr:cytochrome c [Pirellulales bacterium]